MKIKILTKLDQMMIDKVSYPIPKEISIIASDKEFIVPEDINNWKLSNLDTFQEPLSPDKEFLNLDYFLRLKNFQDQTDLTFIIRIRSSSSEMFEEDAGGISLTEVKIPIGFDDIVENGDKFGIMMLIFTFDRILKEIIKASKFEQIDNKENPLVKVLLNKLFDNSKVED